MGKVWFVGAGPGDPDLITIKAQRLLQQAGAVLYAGSLVSKATLEHSQPGCEIQDSKAMDLDQITGWLIEQAKRHEIVVRLQTGDPSLYGALVEMVRPLDQAGIEVAVVPGVSSAMASAAAAVESLTMPETTQTVILTRVEGRTPMPEQESLADLARHHCTLCLFLSINLLDQVYDELMKAGWSESSAVVIVHKAGWQGQELVLRCKLSDMKAQCNEHGLKSQCMILLGPSIGARYGQESKESKLYDPTFDHQFRKAKD